MPKVRDYGIWIHWEAGAIWPPLVGNHGAGFMPSGRRAESKASRFEVHPSTSSSYHLSSKTQRLRLHGLHQIGPFHAFRKTREVFTSVVNMKAAHPAFDLP